MPGITDTAESSSGSGSGLVSGGALLTPITGTRRPTTRPLSCSSHRYTCSRRLHLLRRRRQTGTTARAPNDIIRRFRVALSHGFGSPRGTRDGKKGCPAARRVLSADGLRDGADGTERPGPPGHSEELRAVPDR